MQCPSCNGTGHMNDENAYACFERDGVRPNQYWGCIECDGCGEVEGEEE